MRRFLIVVALSGLFVACAGVASARGPTASAAGQCRTFTGPGDNLVHSANFQAVNVSCTVAKRVVETCRTDGTSCRVAGYRWHCYGRIPGRERCYSGKRIAAITWAD